MTIRTKVYYGNIINANYIRTNPNTPIKGHGLIKDKDAVITKYQRKYEEFSKNDLTYATEERYNHLTDRQTVSRERCP